MLGRVIAGRYRLEARIGEGGMGVVYRARHVLIDRVVAVKLIRPDLRGVGSMDADIAIVHLERHMLEVEYNEWAVFGTDIPDYVLTHDGVPIIDVFRRKR